MKTMASLFSVSDWVVVGALVGRVADLCALADAAQLTSTAEMIRTIRIATS